MNRGRLMAIGRWVLVGGVLVVSLGSLGNVPAATWGGVVISGIGLATNSVGKIAAYARLSIPTGQRISVMGAWLLVVACILGVLLDYAYSVVSPGYEGFFWSLALGSVGFAAIYQGLRSKFVPDLDGVGE